MSIECTCWTAHLLSEMSQFFFSDIISYHSQKWHTHIHMHMYNQQFNNNKNWFQWIIDSELTNYVVLAATIPFALSCNTCFIFSWNWRLAQQEYVIVFFASPNCPQQQQINRSQKKCILVKMFHHGIHLPNIFKLHETVWGVIYVHTWISRNSRFSIISCVFSVSINYVIRSLFDGKTDC